MKSQRLLLAAVALALATAAQAQVKVGSNPGTISTNAVLDVEGTSGSRTVVLQNGNMGIGTTTPAAKLQVEGTEAQFTNGTSKWAVGPTTGGSTGASNSLEIVDRVNSIRRMIFNDNGNAYLGGNVLNNAGVGATMSVVGTSVGVGTLAPVSRLSVVSDGAGSGTADDMEISTFNSSPSIGLYLKSATGTQAAPGNLATGASLGTLIFQGRAGGATQNMSYVGSGYVGNGTTNLSNLVFGTSNAEAMRISETGKIGIGVINPTQKITVQDNSDVTLYIGSSGSDMNGMITLNASARPTSSAIDQFLFFQQSGNYVGSIVSNGSAGVTYQTTSDKRLKENIVTTHFGIKDLMKIGVKDYTMKGIPGKVRTGFLAQDLHTVYPEAVAVGGEDASKNPWTVDYGRITPLLVKSIQDQQVQIEALKKKNQALEAQVSDVASLRSELDAIKALVLKGSPAQKATSVTKR